MTPLKTGIAAACFFLSPLLHAQADTVGLHEAKMKMICAAVNFYSEDKKLSDKRIDCKSLEVAGLKGCAAKMINVDKKIDKWNGIPIHDEAGLRQLIGTILNDVTQKKEYRKSFSSYSSFKSRLSELSMIKADMPIGKPEVTVSRAAPADTVPIGTADAHLPAESAPVVFPKDPPPQAPSPLGVPFWQDPLVWSAAALLIAILALIVALLARRRSQRRQPGRSRKLQSGFDEADGGVSPSGFLTLQKKVTELEHDLRRIKVNMDDTEQVLNDKLRQLEAVHTGPQQAAPQAAIANAPFPVTKRWAKNVDGGGFDLDALAPDPDSKMIYEITQTGRNAATYKVSDARDAQQFALSNPQNYLREGCTYTTQPTMNSQIRTETPGTLELQGRKWKIISLAQIAFS